ncbi:PAS domain-containing sensor histidine kinase [Tundrisphaera lichenicola]|uniref:PAS domain-containing sensor histidine kinase n=1 Tax=Tundrisphaera lichenicola TaxID=2029860 RepID=UPI003EBA2228
MKLPSLDAQARFFFRLIESTAQPFVAVDMDLRFVLVNPAFSEMVGYLPEELVGMTIADITPERWIEPGRKALAELLRTGHSVRYEKEYRRKDGRIVPVEAVVDLDRDEDGQIRGYYSFVTETTERKLAEFALRESEERFRRLYDEAPFGYHEIDLEGRIAAINQTECEMLGYDRSEMLGHPVVDFLAEESREIAKTAVMEKLRGERPLVPIQRTYQCRDGRQLVVAIVERHRLDDSGRIIGIRSTIEDITSRTQIEAALMASERRARALFDGIEDIVFVHDLDGHILDANPAACRRLGYTRDEFLTLTTFDVDDPEFSIGFRERLRRQLDRRHIVFEGRHRTSDGRVLPVDISTSMIQLEDQTAVLAVCRDITERKALEEAHRQYEEAEARNARAIEAKNRDLVRSEARYRLLTEGSHDAVVVADGLGRITLFNPAAERTFGYGADEIIGRPLSDLMPMALRDSYHLGLGNYLECGESRVIGHTVELTGLRKDGEEFPLELSLSAVEFDGEFQFIGSIRDQTESHRMRAMLVQSEKLASIGLLSAGIAHEINNPLAYVGNNLAVLERDFKGVLAMMDLYQEAQGAIAQLDPERLRMIQALSDDLDWPYVRSNLERMLSRTREGIQRVAAIVQNLRGLARTSPPKMEPVVISELILPSLEMVRGRLQRGGIKIIEKHESRSAVHCLASQIGQVVLNLLVNAIQAIESMGRGEGGRIEVVTQEVGDSFLIMIGDNGPGIAPESLSKLFDPFYTTKSAGEGTGLGLSISHGIIAGHGGRIEVESEVGNGTRFRIFLPLYPSKKA